MTTFKNYLLRNKTKTTKLGHHNFFRNSDCYTTNKCCEKSYSPSNFLFLKLQLTTLLRNKWFSRECYRHVIFLFLKGMIHLLDFNHCQNNYEKIKSLVFVYTVDQGSAQPFCSCLPRLKPKINCLFQRASS